LAADYHIYNLGFPQFTLCSLIGYPIRLRFHSHPLYR
jgi:hypothetical protein